ncbi:MAG TPA: UDP-glucose 4-epimerase GalE [Clostridiales bacterium]|jgi:UDP-glucose 4-epimerase|nr:UDP-glucose 4-epimerase GalE [Clostridiales bacterium]HRT81698.1 UDP-glucose 4-epimerase GalE [Oscillospiraceae bacterium]
MAILITGGAGYIGSHTAVELMKTKHEIIILDNFCNSNRESLARIEELGGRENKFYEADIRSRQDLDKIFKENDIKAVIHFAALKAVGESCAMPLEYYENNVGGTVTLLQAMKAAGCKKIVFSSSATVYGSENVSPLKEDMPLGKATNPYGTTKMYVEQILQDLYKSDKTWSVSLLRYFNPVGAHKSGRIGESPNGIPNNLMPYITQVAVGKLEYLRVYGNDYPTIDGTGVRDYIHVVDLAAGHVKALEKILTGPGCDIYNLGTGKGNSVLQVVAAFEKASGVKIPYKFFDRRPGDIAENFADPAKANAELGWYAERGLDEMCEDSWRWQSQNPDGY